MAAYTPIRYPKWVGDTIVNSADEERALLGKAYVDEGDPVSIDDGAGGVYSPEEYPKWVSGVLVEDEAEELAQMDRQPAPSGNTLRLKAKDAA